MNSKVPHKQIVFDDFILKLSGQTWNSLLTIGKFSRKLAMIGLLISILFFILFVAGHLAFMDSDGDQARFMHSLIHFGTPALFTLFTFFYLFRFATKTEKAMKEMDEPLLRITLKDLKFFIFFSAISMFSFLAMILIVAFFL